MQHTIAQVQRASGEAVETLRTIMNKVEAPASARVSAAKTVLDMALKVEAEDIEDRLQALEQMMPSEHA